MVVSASNNEGFACLQKVVHDGKILVLQMFRVLYQGKVVIQDGNEYVHDDGDRDQKIKEEKVGGPAAVHSDETLQIELAEQSLYERRKARTHCRVCWHLKEE